MSIPPDQDRRPSIAERASGLLDMAKQRKSSLLQTTLGLSSSSLHLNSLGPNVKDREREREEEEKDKEKLFSMKADDYELQQCIGQGSSAQVFLAVYKPQGRKVSIKVIDLDMFERNQIDELRRELQIMTLSKHSNLLPVYGSFVAGSKLYIVTPFLSAGSGLDIMKTRYQKGMEESVVATILKQVLQGLEYLHAHGLIHRDIKAGNVLVNDNGLVQLADFGVSSSLTDHGSRNTSRKTFVGTPCWMAPEVMDQSGYDYKADIWSFGITALELANGHAPYAKFPPMKVLMLTLQNPPPSLDRDRTFHKYSKSFKEMIDACLLKDPTKRPTAEKLLTFSFFKSAKKPAYLVTSLLQGLIPVTERKHQPTAEKDHESTTHEEWDFDDPASPGHKKMDSFTFEDSRESAKEVKFEENEDSKIIIPKKSRFVVDSNQSPANQRSDSTASRLDASGSSTSLAPSAEVRKGRFSVIDPLVKEASASASGSLSVSLSSLPHSTSAVSQLLPVPLNSAHMTQSPLALTDKNAPVTVTEDTTSSSNGNVVEGAIERKAGRFAYQNLPTSAVTSPLLGPSEGPKVPRKFTIVSDTPVSDKDKKSRFHVVDGTEATILANSVKVLDDPIPAHEDPVELGKLLKKQNENMRKMLEEVVKYLQNTRIGKDAGVKNNSIT